MTVLVMRTGGVGGACGRLAGRGLALAVAAGVVAAMVGASAGSAAASSAPHRDLRHGARAVPGPGLTLARAPAGLRAAVRKTVGSPATAAGSGLQKAKLTASDGGVDFGVSVAISGSTAVVGSPIKNSAAGAAYVYTRSSTGTWSQRAELTASDAATGDRFGASVAVSGSTAVVGAIEGNAGTGAAYVFTRSSTGTWSQRAELTASDGVAGDEFGGSVALSNSTVVVGAPTSAFGPGAAYVFTGSGSSWTQRAELTAADGVAGDEFGGSVALSGSTAVVGAYAKNSLTGAAYVFTHTSGGTWFQQAKLTDPGATSGDEFGASVALSGSTAVVGAPAQYTATATAGAAYVFTRSFGNTWTQQAKLTAADGAANDGFGAAVALSGSIAVVSAPDKNSNTGASYEFTRSTGGTWLQQAEPIAADGASGDQFGFSVAISGSTAVVGAPFENSDHGAAYVFVLPSQQAELAASDGGGQLGTSVAISGSTAVVGAPTHNNQAGAAYVFVRSGSTWTQQAELTAADGATYDNFGRSVAISGSTVVVGAFYHNSGIGAAYVFTGSGGTWTQRAELTAADGATGGEFGYSVALAGSTAVIGAPGNNSFAGAAYVFTGSGGTWTQRAELTAADGAANDYFGWSVALSGSTAVVGAPDVNVTHPGAAYVFTGSGGTWTQQAELTAPAGATGYDFGYVVALSGSTALISGDGVYVFTRSSGGTWSERAELTASGVGFGWSVAISGSTAVVGAIGVNTYAGAAYVFTGSGGTWTQQVELTAADGAAYDHLGWSVAISGTTAVAGAPARNGGAGAMYAFVNV